MRTQLIYSFLNLPARNEAANLATPVYTGLGGQVYLETQEERLEFTLIAAAFLLGGFVQGSAGFGSGLIGIALLGLAMPVRDAAVLNVLASLAINIVMMIRLKEHVSLRKIAPLIPAVMVGVPIGVLILVRAPVGVLNVTLALILVLSSLQALMRDRIKILRPWHPVYIGIPCGVLSGALTGAYGTGGPPLVAYVLSQGFERRRFAAAIQTLFLVSGSFRLFELIRNGVLHAGNVNALFVAAGAATVGAAVGLQILHRISERVFRRGVAVFLLVLATRYVLSIVV